MHVLDLDNQWALLTALEAHLPQRVKGACSYGFWRQEGKRCSPVFDAQQLEEVWCRFFGVHADFVQRQAHLLDDGFRALGLADATVITQDVDQGMIRYTAAVGETTP